MSQYKYILVDIREMRTSRPTEGIAPRMRGAKGWLYAMLKNAMMLMVLLAVVTCAYAQDGATPPPLPTNVGGPVVANATTEPAPPAPAPAAVQPAPVTPPTPTKEEPKVDKPASKPAPKPTPYVTRDETERHVAAARPRKAHVSPPPTTVWMKTQRVYIHVCEKADAGIGHFMSWTHRQFGMVWSTLHDHKLAIRDLRRRVEKLEKNGPAPAGAPARATTTTREVTKTVKTVYVLSPELKKKLEKATQDATAADTSAKAAAASATSASKSADKAETAGGRGHALAGFGVVLALLALALVWRHWFTANHRLCPLCKDRWHGDAPCGAIGCMCCHTFAAPAAAPPVRIPERGRGDETEIMRPTPLAPAPATPPAAFPAEEPVVEPPLAPVPLAPEAAAPPPAEEPPVVEPPDAPPAAPPVVEEPAPEAAAPPAAPAPPAEGDE